MVMLITVIVGLIAVGGVAALVAVAVIVLRRR